MTNAVYEEHDIIENQRYYRKFVYLFAGYFVYGIVFTIQIGRIFIIENNHIFNVYELSVILHVYIYYKHEVK